MSLNSDNKDSRMPPPVVAHCIIHWIIDPENSPKDIEHYIFTSSPLRAKVHQWLFQVSTKLLPVKIDLTKHIFTW